MNVWYNEIDPYCARWLRNLIAAGHIAPGVVDERSIIHVKPEDLEGYAQCHFFAGIGIWSLALRKAGWPDDQQVWTGSCPCQPFSNAGKAVGFDDERHLWPHFQWLIQQRRPSVVFGEQVAEKNVDAWVDLVHADLEALDYAFGCIAFPSAGVGSPQLRGRNYWVGYTKDAGLQGLAGYELAWDKPQRHDAYKKRFNPATSIPDRVENTDGGGRGEVRLSTSGDRTQDCQKSANWNSDASAHGFTGGLDEATHPGEVNGFWANADWLLCTDGLWRAVQPGTQPLVNGDTCRVGKLRAYGNAVNAIQAQIFIECFIECTYEADI